MLGGNDGGTAGGAGGANIRFIAIAVLLSLTLARIPGSTRR